MNSIVTQRMGPQIGSGERLGFTLFLAAVFHGLLILGVGFGLPDAGKSQSSASVDVLLAQYHSAKKPDEADFIGQADQMGGGTEEEAVAMTTDQLADIPDPDAEQAQPTTATSQQPAETTFQVVVATQARLQHQQLQQKSTPLLETGEPSDERARRQQEIAALEAQLDQQKQQLAKKPRERAVSPAIHRSSDALYLDSWRKIIERVGNANYPEKARTADIFGELTLKVAIRTDGSVYDIAVLKSSGSKILDDAAIRIARLAAPYPPLTEEMKRDTDVLEIIRTWKFSRGDQLTTN